MGVDRARAEEQLAGELERTDTAEGVRVRGLVPVTVAERYERFAVSNGAG